MSINIENKTNFPFVAPSLLSADFANLAKDIDMINNSQADWFHLDVMDGMFVPNISFGIPIIKAIKKYAKKTLDVHLMIEKPERYIKTFKDAGADILTIHYEAETHLHRTIHHIKENAMRAGVALNPHTPVHLLNCIIKDIDMVLIMSVNPGFGGQKFIEQSYEKIKELKKLIEKNNATTWIQVDGGVTHENAKKLVACGVDILVAGNTVFSAENPKESIAKLKNCY